MKCQNYNHHFTAHHINAIEEHSGWQFEDNLIHRELRSDDHAWRFQHDEGVVMVVYEQIGQDDVSTLLPFANILPMSHALHILSLTHTHTHTHTHTDTHTQTYTNTHTHTHRCTHTHRHTHWQMNTYPSTPPEQNSK